MKNIETCSKEWFLMWDIANKEYRMNLAEKLGHYNTAERLAWDLQADRERLLKL